MTTTRIDGRVQQESQWQLYVSATGNAVVEREIRDSKLTISEQGLLQRMLDRIESGQTLKKDTKYLKQFGLFEARLDGDRRIFRLLFAKRQGGSILLGLYFTAKKSMKLPKQALDTARRRCDEWDERNPT